MKKNVDNMSKELMEVITEYLGTKDLESIELAKDILFFLYNTTNDKILKMYIEDWFEEMDYCIDCGCKLFTKEYQEYRDGFGGCYETIYEKICENCNF